MWFNINGLWYYYYYYYLGTQFQGKKNYAMQRQNTKTSWNGLYYYIVIIIRPLRHCTV